MLNTHNHACVQVTAYVTVSHVCTCGKCGAIVAPPHSKHGSSVSFGHLLHLPTAGQKGKTTWSEGRDKGGRRERGEKREGWWSEEGVKEGGLEYKYAYICIYVRT